MAERARSVRRNMGVLLLVAAFLVLAWWALTSVRELQHDNRVLTQQVEQLGGEPLKSPRPGPTGAQGKQGETGTAGTSGRNGRDGRDGKPGAAGKNGKDGAPGSPGPAVTGPSGAPGTKGEKGDTGEKGDKGDPGDPGPTCREGFHPESTTVVTPGGPRDAEICVKD